jgi:hypothetical protein
MLRAELCVHKKSTFNGLISVTLNFQKLTAFANVLRGQLAGLPLATVLGQVSQYGIHAVVLGPIDQMTTTALLRNEIGMHQLFQVK